MKKYTLNSTNYCPVNGVYLNLQSVQSYITPSIAAAFLLGIFWKRINATGAVAALFGGFFIGMFRLVLELNKDMLSGFWFWFADLNFLYLAIFSFLGCIALMILVSIFTGEPDYQRIVGLTYATTVVADREKSLAR